MGFPVSDKFRIAKIAFIARLMDIIPKTWIIFMHIENQLLTETIGVRTWNKTFDRFRKNIENPLSAVIRCFQKAICPITFPFEKNCIIICIRGKEGVEIALLPQSDKLINVYRKTPII